MDRATYFASMHGAPGADAGARSFFGYWRFI
jgi:hypothetical protein